MSINLLNILSNQVSTKLSSQASSFLNEDQSNVSKALGNIFPTLLGSVIHHGSNEEGASTIMEMTKKVNMEFLDDVIAAFSGGRADVMMSSGDKIINTLLGNKFGGATDLISKISGIQGESSRSLFKMSAPLLIGMIGKQVQKDNLGVSGLMNMLMNQKEHVQRNIPAGMGTVLGLGSLFSTAKDDLPESTKSAVGVTKDSASYATKSATFEDPESEDSASLWRFLIPALLVLGAIYFMTQSKMCADTKVDKMGDTMEESIKESVEEVEEAVVERAEDLKEGVEKTWDAVRGAFLNVNQETKAMLDSMKFKEGTAGFQMVNFIKDGNGNALFQFKNLNFETGSAQINQESDDEVEHIASILHAYPDVTIELSGHTDNTGEEPINVELSKARAEAVKAKLTAEGIDGGRITTEGYGSAFPLVSNRTEEGKEKNRRIEIRVTN